MVEDHAMRLGKLLGNLQSIEAVLRMCLMPSAKQERDPNKPTLWELKVGDVVALDAFTDFDPLSKLVERFNTDISRTRPDLAVSTEVVDLRNLLAHGRVVGSDTETTDIWIMKFSRPNSSGQATVTHYAEMNEKWFDDQMALTLRTFEKLSKVLHMRGLFDT